MYGIRKSFSLFFGMLFTAAFSSCSPSVFTGDTSDKRIDGQQSIRANHPQCSSFQLGSDELSVSDFKGLLSCFNSNHSIDPLVNFFGKLKDQDLKVVVRALNVGILTSDEERRQSLEILESLSRQEKLESTVKNLGKFLKNSDAITRIYSEGLNSKILDRFRANKNVDDRRGTLSVKPAFQWVDLFHRIESQPSFADLRERVLSRSLSEEERTTLSKSVSSLLGILERSVHWKSLKEKKTTDEWIRILRTLTGRDKSEIQSFSTLNFRMISELTGKQSFHLGEVSQLVRILESPVECMHGGRVFTAPWTDITKEFQFQRGPKLRSFVTDFASTVGLAIQDFCTVPRDFYSVFPDFYRIVATNWGERALDWVAVLGDEGLADDLSRLLVEVLPTLQPLLKLIDDDRLLLDGVLLMTSMSDSDLRALSTAVNQFGPRKNNLSSVTEILSISKSASALVEWLDPKEFNEGLAEVQKLLLMSQSHPWFDATLRILNSVDMSEAPTLSNGDLNQVLEFVYEMSQDGRLSSLVLDFYRLFKKRGEVTNDVLLPEGWDKGKSFHSLRLGEMKIEDARSTLTDRDEACLKIQYDRKWSEQFDIYFSCLGSERKDGSTFSAVSRLEKEGLFESFVETFSKWPWNPEQFREMLPSFSRFISSGDLSQIIGNFRSIAAKTLSTLGRALSVSDPSAFFHHFSDWIRERNHFTLIQQIVESSNEKAPRKKNLKAGLPKLSLFDAYLTGKECIFDEDSLNERKNQLLSESKIFDTGAHPSEFRSLLKWVRTPNFDRLLGGVFTATHTAGKPRLSATDLNHFLHQYSEDSTLFSTYSLEKGGLEVRLLTGLEQLQFLLNESNFKILAFDNFAVKFIGDIATAWGDEPRERWPEEIKALYPTGRPKTLREVVQGLRSFLNRYERLAGLPKIRNCDASVTNVNLPPDPAFDFQPLSFAVPLWVKVRLFNIHQMLPFIEANQNSGMKVIRELAFQFWRVDSVETLLNLGKADVLHGASILFSHRSDSLEKAAESKVFSQLLEGQMSAGPNSPVQKFIRSAIMLMPVDLGSKLGKALSVPIDFSASALHSSIDALLYSTSLLPPEIASDYLSAYVQDFINYEKDWRIIVQKLEKAFRRGIGSGKWVSDLESVTRNLFLNSEKLGSDSPVTKLLGSWGSDFETAHFVASLSRNILMEADLEALPSNIHHTEDFGALNRGALDLVKFLSESPSSVRGQAATEFREKVLSDALRGPTLQKWLTFFHRDPVGAVKTLEALLGGLDEKDFKTFLMTAGRQLPH